MVALVLSVASRNCLPAAAVISRFFELLVVFMFRLALAGVTRIRESVRKKGPRLNKGFAKAEQKRGMNTALGFYFLLE